MNRSMSILTSRALLYSVLTVQGQSLPNTSPLTLQGDLAAQMVAGIDTFLMRETQYKAAQRERHWKRDFSSAAAYLLSVEPNRQRLRKITGVVDARETSSIEIEAGEIPVSSSPRIGKGTGYSIYAVRWNVLQGVQAEGLLLLPDKTPVADIVALPDCDWTPEMLAGLGKGIAPEAQFARRLVENGCRVLVPLLIDRQDTYSGTQGSRMTNQPHREFLYRPAYELGRHIIGYEVQKTLAAIDWFAQTAGENGKAKRRPLGVMGYGEGGLIAFYAAAMETRIEAVAVSGYFQPREALWREPIYRNVFGLLEQFGDAEIASLIAPRALIIEACRHPESAGPSAPKQGRSGGAAPGILETPSLAAVQGEFARARHLTEALKPAPVLQLVGSGSGLPGSDSALTELLQALGITRKLVPLAAPPVTLRKHFDPEPRRKRQFEQILEHTQHCLREAPERRNAFWKKTDASSAEAWEKSLPAYRDFFWEEIIGKLPAPTLPVNPRTRQIYDTPKFRGYEVVLDVYPDVFAYGILLIPKDIQPGERRAVVVCQHGLEGRPQEVADPATDSPYYHQFACKLAERGYITFAPQNPYIGEDKFRVLLRKAQPLKQTLFAVIVRQHERILDWLASLPYVDPQRMAFYGLSYGGKTAMRVPALLNRYCLSICSADYNEWIWKNASATSNYSYLFTGEYDMPEFDLGNTFNYAEMSWLICPRPFMVERGHHDGVAPDEWVAYEFARTRRRYDLLGLGDRTEIEFFNGPHTINGVGTFSFLDKHLKSR